MISLHEEERLSQIQAELAVISHAEGQQKLQIAELSQSLALARSVPKHHFWKNTFEYFGR